MAVDEIIKDIRRQCRLAMNGVVSSSMREQGLQYKLNFGVSIQKIKEISKRYQSSSVLAERLWLEDTRELKILATMLYPVAEFNEGKADEWMKEIPNQEIREQICLNLFQYLPFSSKIALDWSNSENETDRITGYWLLVRLLLQKKIENISLETLVYLFDDIVNNENVTLRNATLSAMKRIGRLSNAIAQQILLHTDKYKNSDNVLEREIYDSLKFEFEFYS